MSRNKALLKCMGKNEGLKRVIEDFGINIKVHHFVRDPDSETDIFTCRDCFLTVFYRKNERGKR